MILFRFYQDKIYFFSPNIQQSSVGARKLINQRSEGDCYVAQPSDVVDTHTPFANFDQFEKYENVQEEEIFPGDVYEAERKKLFAR